MRRRRIGRGKFQAFRIRRQNAATFNNQYPLEEMRQSEFISSNRERALASAFRDLYGREAELVASAPGRVNLIGEHTDYNGGEVLPIAIGQRTWIALARAENEQTSRAKSLDIAEGGQFSFANPERSGSWWDYIAGLSDPSLGTFPNADIAISSDVPAGAGLSSSAALQIASATALSALIGSTASARALALMAWKAENEFVGVSSGIMDQFASALSKDQHALHVWCDTGETEQVPFIQSVLVFDTGVSRSLRGSAFNERRAECAEALAILRNGDSEIPNLAAVEPEAVRESNLPPTLKLRALHVSEETRRVRTAVAQLKKNGTLDGNLLYQSHESLRFNYQCSSPELDWFVEHAMKSQGISGARLTGAGWGGCAIALGAREALETAGETIAHDYEQQFRRKARFWITEASGGARIET